MSTIFSIVVLALTANVAAEASIHGPVAPDNDWEAHYYDELEYFRGIDDYIDFNRTKTRFFLI